MPYSSANYLQFVFKSYQEFNDSFHRFYECFMVLGTLNHSIFSFDKDMKQYFNSLYLCALCRKHYSANLIKSRFIFLLNFKCSNIYFIKLFKISTISFTSKSRALLFIFLNFFKMFFYVPHVYWYYSSSLRGN